MPNDTSPTTDVTTLPLLPLRDVVVFPRMVIPLFVGRPKSIKALDVAMDAGKHILLVAQKQAAKDDPVAEDLYDIGSVATVLQMLKLPDGTVKVLVEGTQRARIIRVEERPEYLAADAQQILEMNDVAKRLEHLLGVREGEVDILQVEKRIRGRVKRQMEKSQREYYLNEQVKAIQKELGEGDENADLDEIEKKVKTARMS